MKKALEFIMLHGFLGLFQDYRVLYEKAQGMESRIDTLLAEITRKDQVIEDLASELAKHRDREKDQQLRLRFSRGGWEDTKRETLRKAQEAYRRRIGL